MYFCSGEPMHFCSDVDRHSRPRCRPTGSRTIGRALRDFPFLKTWAGELGMDKAVKLLDATLAEEKKTDEALTELAETLVNQKAQAA